MLEVSNLSETLIIAVLTGLVLIGPPISLFVLGRVVVRYMRQRPHRKSAA
jgi:hypothetical protein